MQAKFFFTTIRNDDKRRVTAVEAVVYCRDVYVQLANVATRIRFYE